LVDTYNHGRFIETALESVLSQDAGGRTVEVLVIDDGSTDDTPERVRKFGDKVRYLRKTNGGQGSAFNVGIPETRGQVVAFLDADDWWAPGKLRAVLDALDREPEVGAVGHGIVEVYGPDERRELLPASSLSLHLRDVESARRFRRLKAFLGTSRLTVRRTVLEKVLPVPEALEVEADEYLFTTSAAAGGLRLLPQPLTYYRLHANNLFQFRRHDPVKARRKFRVMDELVRTLPPALASLGVEPAAIAEVVEPVWVDAERLRLTVDGGWPWETLRVERAAYRLTPHKGGPGYRLLKGLFLGLALALPPRVYFRLRKWYTARGLMKVGAWLGGGKPPGHLVSRWQPVAPAAGGELST
jgi:hypothetical protein